MTRVVLVCYLPTQFVELRRLALAMVRSPERSLEPVISFARSYAGQDESIAFCRENAIAWRVDSMGLDAVPVAAGPVSSAPAPPLRVRLLRLLPAPIRLSIRHVLGFWRARAAARNRMRAASLLLDATGAKLVVLAEDNLDYGTPLLVKLAHGRGVKVMVLPYTVATELEFAEAYFDDEMRRVNILNGWFARRHPHWIYTHRGRELLRLPLPAALLAERAGVAPPKPWIMNSGAADAIAVESEAMLEHYRRCGIPKDRLVLTGSISDDTLAARIADTPRARPALVESLGLPGRKRLVVTGLSPNQVKDRPAALLDFQDYESLVRSWIGTLTGLPDTDVVVSVHPSVPPDSVRFLEESGARIARGRDIAELIPLCDFYVAGASATIRLAISCGKPVINYDAYRFRYDDYANVPGVITVESPADFRSAAQRLTNDASFFDEMAGKQAALARRWSLLDGRSTERLLDLAARLAAS